MANLSKKRTKQVQAMVDYVNECLKKTNVNFSNQYENGNAQNLFHNMCTLLMQVGCYEGFNEYYESTLEVDGQAKAFNKLTGGSLMTQEECPNEKRYIQIE